MASSLLRKKNVQQSVVQSAVFMSAGTFVSRVLGLVRDMVIGSFFSRTETDAFFVAFRIPNFFRRFLGEGALSISFIPVFVQCLSDSTQENPERRARNFMNSVYTILLVCVSILTVLGIILMEPLLQALFSSAPFAAIEGKLQMAVVMARLLFVYLFLVIIYAYFMGVANALGRFFLPALAPAFLNFFMIVFSFLPKGLVSFPPLLLCWGVLAGGMMQVILTAIVLFRLGFLPRIRFSFFTGDLKLMWSRFLPGIFGVGGLALIGLLNLYFSGWLEEGTHTYIYYGDRLLELPRSLIAISLGTALLPNLSYFAVVGERARMLKTAADQRDILLFLILPCALAFYFLGLPIIEALFKRGNFDAFTAGRTAVVLKIYSLLLVSSSLSQVLATCFYAVKNTWYPALCSCLYVLFHWLLTPYMVRAFELEGLVGATVISNVFFMFLLTGAYPFFIGSFYLWRTLKRVIYSLPVLVALSVYMHFSFDFLCENLSIFIGEKEHLISTLALIVIIPSSILLYFGMGYLLYLPQARECLTLIGHKVKKKKNGLFPHFDTTRS
ncbi:MAG: murein biosynthesis integral membrane protein MurJ [Bdellovibrionales bacterium]|nr:murein biosynthesis integral membrane protein MurJ [Bdellovibrionales bacterium]